MYFSNSVPRSILFALIYQSSGSQERKCLCLVFICVSVHVRQCSLRYGLPEGNRDRKFLKNKQRNKRLLTHFVHTVLYLIRWHVTCLELHVHFSDIPLGPWHTGSKEIGTFIGWPLQGFKRVQNLDFNF